MFGNTRNEIQNYLIKEGYDIKEFLNKNGDWYYFKVETHWSGVHTIKVKEGFFGYTKEKVSI
ncbi:MULTISPECIES: hypothetical protein [unclassified Bacillus (in: firmicutes)]|uniref:hypothetical protein n=1 Tax=unclassified Bacillus (in: firmicutes) TaxID=185979 RepID=UPI0008E0D251|nr:MULTISPECIES: hypothetical protein [unclassified Bacillus (in: firmicutes)]SFI12382.1 hypothetical protein SAMN04488574_101684 [Bacillus sp. 71mf]SFS75260.1 hypothetical protein SAMN04488145_10393 [Bacillus sp. 103mf]